MSVVPSTGRARAARPDGRLRACAKGYALNLMAVAWVALCAGALQASETITYQYDALGRLISTSRSGGSQVVYSLDPSGNRTQVQTSGVTTPSVPPSITVPSTSTGSYTISWVASTSGIVTAYELYESTSSSFSPQSLVYSGTGTSFPASKPNGTYYYRVRACNASLCSGYRAGSNAVTVTVPPGPTITLDDVSVWGEESLGTMSFTYRLWSGGGVTVSTTGAASSSGPLTSAWITPQTGMNLYQARVAGGCGIKTGTYGTWLALGTGSTLSWTISLNPNMSALCTMTVSISAISNPSVILDSATIDLDLSTRP